MTSAWNWIDLRRDADSGIETIRAHFQGHAYDAHWHDSYLLGLTEQGVQQFDCRGRRVQSRPGQVFMLEPGEIHNGDAPMADGFTYRLLYLPASWLHGALRQWRGASMLPDRDLSFSQTLTDDRRLGAAVLDLYAQLRDAPPRIVRDAAVDTLLARLADHSHFSNVADGGRDRHRLVRAADEVIAARTYDAVSASASIALSSAISPTRGTASDVYAEQARDYLHAHLDGDIGLDALAGLCGTDRFTLTRLFKARFGVAPHTYLVQLRLVVARSRLARGEPVADVAHAVGFADQSHLGRWFRRVYGLPPAQYRAAAQTFQTRPADAR